MARIEIQIPDRLLVLLKNAAEDAGETREEFLSHVAEEGLVRAGAELREKFEEALGPPIPMGGNAAELIREMRDNRPPIRRGNLDE